MRLVLSDRGPDHTLMTSTTGLCCPISRPSPSTVMLPLLHVNEESHNHNEEEDDDEGRSRNTPSPDRHGRGICCSATAPHARKTGWCTGIGTISGLSFLHKSYHFHSWTTLFCWLSGALEGSHAPEGHIVPLVCLACFASRIISCTHTISPKWLTLRYIHSIKAVHLRTLQCLSGFLGYCKPRSAKIPFLQTVAISVPGDSFTQHYRSRLLYGRLWTQLKVHYKVGLFSFWFVGCFLYYGTNVVSTKLVYCMEVIGEWKPDFDHSECNKWKPKANDLQKYEDVLGLGILWITLKGTLHPFERSMGSGVSCHKQNLLEIGSWKRKTSSDGLMDCTHKACLQQSSMQYFK